MKGAELQQCPRRMWGCRSGFVNMCLPVLLVVCHAEGLATPTSRIMASCAENIAFSTQWMPSSQCGRLGGLQRPLHVSDREKFNSCQSDLIDRRLPTYSFLRAKGAPKRMRLVLAKRSTVEMYMGQATRDKGGFQLPGMGLMGFLANRVGIAGDNNKNAGGPDLMPDNVPQLKVKPQDFEVNFDKRLGDGTYGEVYGGKIVSGPLIGHNVVLKCAKDWTDEDGTVTTVGEILPATEDLAAKYLDIEAYANNIVATNCQEIAATYLGDTLKYGKRWLVWEYVNATSLEDILERCERKGSLAPLAKALEMEDDFNDNDIGSLQRLVNRFGRQLVGSCRAMEKAGLSHRDIKPANMLVTNGSVILIDFGSAAAMGWQGRKGWEPKSGPCDLRYAPPEQLIDQTHWASYDVYCVGLVLLRVLFPPLLNGQRFEEFSDEFHDAESDVDAWLRRVIYNDVSLDLAAAAGLSKHRKPEYVKSFVTRDLAYLEFAEESCLIDAETAQPAKGICMCSLKNGLKLLKEGSGLCWHTIRGMTASEPEKRISSKEVLNILDQWEKANRKEKLVDTSAISLVSLIDKAEIFEEEYDCFE